MKRAVIILSLSIFVCFINCGCKQKLFKTVTYDGQVFDKAGNAISDATVVLKACAGGPADKQQSECLNNLFVIGSSTTDASGHFHITNKAASTDWYFVFVNGIGRNTDGVHAPELTENQFTKLIIY